MFILMNRAKEVLKFDLSKGYITDVSLINSAIAPEQLKLGSTGALERWLSERSIDTTRSNARLLLKKMQLPMSKVDIVVNNKGLCLTDTYWIKTKNTELFTNVCLHRKRHDDNIVSTTLFGTQNRILVYENPELTNIGSFDKAWVNVKNNWFLVKRGSMKSMYAELFASELGKKLKLDITQYLYRSDIGGVYSKNFTTETQVLEHYASYRYKFNNIAAHDRIIYSNLNSEGMGAGYLDMLLFDALINNVDRHEFNFGVLKNSTNGNVIKLAPIYDNNLAFGGTTNPSLVHLKIHLEQFKIPVTQTKLINRFMDLLKQDMKGIRDIDREVRSKVNPADLSLEQLLIYFKGVENILKNF